MSADLLANVERDPEQRPRPVVPVVPDLEPPEGFGYWHGAAGADAAYWRRRALAAEALVAGLRRALARYRVRP